MTVTLQRPDVDDVVSELAARVAVRYDTVERLEAENRELATERDALRARLSELEQAVTSYLELEKQPRDFNGAYYEARNNLRRVAGKSLRPKDDGTGDDEELWKRSY